MEKLDRCVKFVHEQREVGFVKRQGGPEPQLDFKVNLTLNYMHFLTAAIGKTPFIFIFDGSAIKALTPL